MKPMSNSKLQISNSEKIQNEICKLLQLPHERYCNAVLAAGNLFLSLYIGAANPLKNDILSTRSYWNWFKNQWELIDEVFLLTYGDYGMVPGVEETLRRYYYDEHHPDRMIQHPPLSLFDISYAEMFEKAMWENSLSLTEPEKEATHG